MVISMDRWKDKVAVVTGGASGIGAATATKLIDFGLKVACLDFSKDNLETFKKSLQGKSGKFTTLQVDVTQEDDVLKAFKWIKENLGPVHMLINCAGVARLTGLTNGSTEMWKTVLDTNVLGLCIATREAVKDMRASNVNGHIVHINSIWGHGIYNTNIASMNLYPASKHAVTALTETLRQELNSIGSKIKVTSISPGFVRTGILSATVKASGLSDDAVKQMEQALKSRITLSPEDVADAIVYVLSTPPHVQVHELTIKPIQEPE